MNKKTIIIDTRDPVEYAASHVDGAINIPPEEFISEGLPPALQNVPKNQQIILYCRTGQRSNTCNMHLRQYGFTNVINGVNEQRARHMIGVS